MFLGGVVGHHVDDHLQSSAVQGRDQRLEVGQRAEPRIDVAVVDDVVATVGERGRIERAEPDRIHAQLREIADAGGDPRQVTDAVTVGVGEAPRVDLVDHG